MKFLENNVRFVLATVYMETSLWVLSDQKRLFEPPLKIGYAFYDVSENELEVLFNDEYDNEFREIAINLVDDFFNGPL